MDISARTYSLYHHGISHRIISNDVIVCDKSDSPICKKISALWDSGASICAINKTLAEEMKLISLGKKPVGGVHGNQEVNYYIVDIKLPNGVTISDLEVIECNTQEHFIIGMNVLTLGDFCISNHQGKTTMTFVVPSQKKTDYVDDWNKEHLAKISAGRPKIPQVFYQNKKKHKHK